MSSVNFDNRGRIGCPIYDATNLTPAEKRIENFAELLYPTKSRLRTGAEALADIRGMDRGRTPAGPAPARNNAAYAPNGLTDPLAFDGNFEAFLDDASKR